MAELTCPTCGSPVQPGDLICFECGANLARASYGPPAVEETPRPVASSPPALEDNAARTCPHCGARVADFNAVVCFECLRPLEEPPSTAPTLTLRFPGGASELAVKPGESLALGRDPAHSPAAELLARFDNISRRHATIMVSDQGEARVSDENSTNGTFVNEHRVPANQQLNIFDGDIVRLAADCRIAVSLPTT